MRCPRVVSPPVPARLAPLDRSHAGARPGTRRLADLALALTLATLAAAACGGEDTGGTNVDSDAAVNTGNQAPVVTIRSPEDGAFVAAGEAVTFTGTVGDDNDAPDALTVLWTSDRAAAPLSQAPANSLGGTTIEVASLAPGRHVITLGATDRAGKVGTAVVTITVNSAPGAPEVSIAPPNPKAGDDLVATVTRDAQDPNRASSELTYSYRWFKNGTFANVTTATVAAALTKKGETWEVRVAADDGFANGAEGVGAVTIGNSAPSCTTANIFPTAANTTKDITCSCSGWTDPDGDAADDHCTFFDGAAPLPGDGACTLPEAATEKGMEVHCAYTPGDGTDDGAAVTSASVPVLNAPPSAPTVALTPTTADATTTVACSLSAAAVDPDGDSVTYEVTWLVDNFENPGVTASSLVAGSLLTSAGQKAKRGSRLACRLRASDGAATSAPATSAEVVLNNAAPTVDNVLVTSVGGAHIDENAVLRCVAGDQADPDGDAVTLVFVWYVQGVEVAGASGQNLTGASFKKGDTVSCAARAEDGEGGQSALSTAKSTVTIGNAPPALLGASLDKTNVSAFEQVTCIPEGWQDPDGDPLEVNYAWFQVSGTTLTAISGQTSSKLTPDMLAVGNSFLCQVTPKNGLDLGAPVQSAPATVIPPAATAPIVTVNAPEGAAGAVRCDFVEPAKHFAGAITYTFYWRLNGGLENAGNATITGLNDCDLAACRAVATDGTTTLSSAPASQLLPVGDDCATGDDCKTATCKAGGGCNFVLASDIVCDDNNGCTTDDHCELGICIAGGFAGDGAPCEDGEYCTATDTCDGAGGCNGGASPCQATAGGCLVGSCDELENKCIVATKPANSPCNDNDGCTTSDFCSANGACLPGTPVTCAQAGDQCNAAACNSLGPNDHSCVLAPKPAGAECSTGDFCTTGETCNGQGSCAGGTDRDCDAEVGDDCNTAYCEPTLQRCMKVPATTGTSCDDGNACTVVDGCVNGVCEGTGNACVEEQISQSGGDQRPTVVSIGFGRYVTQWWATTSAPTHLRYSDAYGSRENEEIASSATSRVPAWSTRMAARSTGTIAVPYYSGSYWTPAGSAYPWGIVSMNAAARGRAFDLTGASLVDATMFPMAVSCNAYYTGDARCGYSSYQVQSLALPNGDFAFLASGTSTTSGNVNTLSYSPPQDVISFHPPTGLMTTGTRIDLVAATEMASGIGSWDAKPANDGSGTFLLAWLDPTRTSVKVRRYSALGEVASGNSTPWTVFSSGTNRIEQVRVVGLSDSNFIVLWDVIGTDTSGRGVYGARLNSEGGLIGSVFRVNTQTPGDQRLGEVARFSNNDFVVVFDDQNGDTNGWGVKARLYSSTAVPKGGVMDINTTTAGSQVLPTVEVLDTDEWVVAFIDDHARVWTRRFLQSGGPAMGRIEWQLNATTDGAQKGVAAARIGGTALVVYESPVYGKQEGEILARTLATTGPNVGPEQQVNQTDAGPQLRPAIAAGTGRFAVAWESGQQDDPQNAVFVRFYDASGGVVGSEVKVSTSAASFHRNAAVGMGSDDHAAVAWAEAVTGTSISDIYLRLMAADGTGITAPIKVNAFTTGIQDKPAVAVGPDGMVVVAWQSNGQDGSNYGVYLRKFDASGNVLSDDVQVNTQVDLDQKTPSIAIAPTGNRMTVCWESLGQDAPNSLGVYCQVMAYDTLNKLASEVKVSPLSAGEQRNPKVAYLVSGELIVGWDSEGVDSDRFAVQYRRLTALGAPSGARVLGNRTWAGSQEKPAVVPLSGAGLLVLWEATDQDGSDRGVYFRVMSTY